MTVGGNSEVATKDRMDNLEQVMRRIGLAYRELGTASVLGYSLYVGIILIFYSIEEITFGQASLNYRNDGFVLANMRPDLADLQLRRLFQRCIGQVSESMEAPFRANNRIGSINYLTRQTDSISQLNEQRSYLRHFSKGPGRSKLLDSRHGNWLQEQRMIALSLYLLISMGFFVTAIIANQFTQYIVYQRLALKGMVPFNFMEKFSFIEQLIVVIITLDSFATPVVLLVANFRDKLLYLAKLRSRFSSLERSLVKLRLMHSPDGRPDLKTEKQQRCNGEDSFDGLKEQVNHDALEIYLRLRVFMLELGPTIKLANMIMNQCFFFISLVLAFTLAFYTSLDQILVRILSLVVIQFVCGINLAFGVCAAFNAICVRTTLIAWTLLAHSTLVPRGNHEDPFRDAGRYRTTLELDFCKSGGRQSLVNVHTISLWRRLVTNQTVLLETFSCHVLASIKLDYSNILRLNFWFISVVLIVFTERQQ